MSSAILSHSRIIYDEKSNFRSNRKKINLRRCWRIITSKTHRRYSRLIRVKIFAAPKHIDNRIKPFHRSQIIIMILSMIVLVVR